MFEKGTRQLYSHMHFPMDREETYSRAGQAAALAVLTEAAERCRDRDMRTVEVSAALAYLADPFKAGACGRFREALNDPTPCGRVYRVKAAIRAIRREIGLTDT